MKMKTKYFWMLVVAFMMGTQVINAQADKPKGKREHKRPTMEQIIQMQSQRIVDELGLDDKTAAKFAEVYKKYMKEMDDLRKQYMPAKSDLKKDKPSMPKSLTDAEVDKMMRDRFAQARKMLDVREKYYDEFRKFLSPKQVQKVYNQGMANKERFHKEMRRRSDMKKDGKSRGMSSSRPMQKNGGQPQ
jgi:hypothetical protein